MDTPTKWDRPAIVAAVHRRKMTLTGIAIDAGLYPSACRQGLLGKSRPGAEAIATALGIPFRTLFPDSYSRGRHGEGKTTSNDRCNGSAKAAPDLDKAAAVT